MIESERIQSELDQLDDSYSEHGIVRTVLRERVTQERVRERECDIGDNNETS